VIVGVILLGTAVFLVGTSIGYVLGKRNVMPIVARQRDLIDKAEEYIFVLESNLRMTRVYINALEDERVLIRAAAYGKRTQNLPS
jgi:membrane protein DedA with SNARE-associated domain